MKISLIVAMDKNRVIGKDNDIPWSIPNDWQYVKNITRGHAIILGRKTLDSLDGALPDRRNIVITRNRDYSCADCEIVHSVEEALTLCTDEEEIFIFGGEHIYKLFHPYVEKMYITKVDHEFNGDTFFPEVDYSEWKEVSVEKGIKNDQNPFDYYFHVYEKKSKQ
ncbi:dihydrofolate reductase [Virgibacillus necropolis]|uniref:dihydrofolate reductase n=1 Tax=Virgibacillus necropolis TaxID=163877 RepID=UPI00384D4F50